MFWALIAAAGAVQTSAVSPAPIVSLPHIPPRLLNGAPQVTARDYPAIARRDGQEGKVTVSLSIGVMGRVTSCGIIRSSAFAMLDEAACRLWTKHARFDPARDAAGAPVVSAAQATIVYLLPEAPSENDEAMRSSTSP